MTISFDWTHFTPFTSLAGGALIGLAAVMLMFVKGRIAGISGILGSLLQWHNAPKGHFAWRASFLLGLLLSSAIWGLFAAFPALQVDASYLTLLIAGLLVGFGTRMASGCTSGHAVCGLGRFSLRSLVATVCFMSAGFVTAFLFFHLA